MLNSKEIIDRIQNKLNLKNDAEIARLFKFHQTNLQNWRDRNTIAWEKLFNLCQEYHWSFDWLLTGEEKTHPSCYVECNPEIKPLCEKLKNVINSETKYAKVLKENIEAFDLAVKDGLEASGNRRKSDKLISSLTARIEHLEKMFDLKLNTDTD